MPTPPPDLLLTYDFPPMGGGISRWMAALAAHYPGGGLVVSTGRGAGGNGTPDPGNVERVDLPSERLRGGPGLLAWCRQARAVSVRHDVRAIWCANLKPAGYPAWWVHRALAVPYGMIVHGTDLLVVRTQMGSPFKRAIARRLLGDAAVIVANSEPTAQLARSVGGELGLRTLPPVEVIHPGTDPDRFHPRQLGAGERSGLGLPAGPFLLSVARLTPHKGMDTGIEALALLRPAHPDLSYVIVGGGGDRPRLEALASSLRLGNAVRFLGDVPDDQVPLMHSQAAVYVALSRAQGRSIEGYGISAAEASASGVPVVASRSGGLPEAVLDGQTGTLVAPAEPEAAARAIGAYLEDPALAAAHGAAGREHVLRAANWNHMAGRFAHLAEAMAHRPVTGA